MSSISIAGLSWHTPNNNPLFTNLNLTFGLARTGLVRRNGTGEATLLRLIAGELSPVSGMITKPSSVAFLCQSPEQLENATVADLFGATELPAVLARAERGEATTDELANADWSLDARLRSALKSLGFEQTHGTPPDRLSGG